jgi:hypothetical protein
MLFPQAILTQASQIVGDQLIQMNALTADVRDGLKAKAYTDEFDEDILPRDVVDSDEKEEKDEWDISNIE